MVYGCVCWLQCDCGTQRTPRNKSETFIFVVGARDLKKKFMLVEEQLPSTRVSK